MHNFGATRSARRSSHFLQTPDTFIRASLPGMKNCTAIVHAAPAMGAGFTQYTAEFEAGGELGETSAQRFIYVLEGNISIKSDATTRNLTAAGFAFFPDNNPHQISSQQASRVAVVEKSYEPITAVEAPELIISSEHKIASKALEGDEDLQVKCLLPDSLSFDFAVNTMTYQPGAALKQVEMHIMEHGLLMLEGGGIYRLGDSWYPVTAGDFVWMAPWCPQWFGAIGKIPAKYLIYKNWNRHPLGANAR